MCHSSFAHSFIYSYLFVFINFTIFLMCLLRFALFPLSSAQKKCCYQMNGTNEKKNHHMNEHLMKKLWAFLFFPYNYTFFLNLFCLESSLLLCCDSDTMIPSIPGFYNFTKLKKNVFFYFSLHWICCCSFYLGNSFCF